MLPVAHRSSLWSNLSKSLSSVGINTHLSRGVSCSSKLLSKSNDGNDEPKDDTFGGIESLLRTMTKEKGTDSRDDLFEPGKRDSGRKSSDYRARDRSQRGSRFSDQSRVGSDRFPSRDRIDRQSYGDQQMGRGPPAMPFSRMPVERDRMGSGEPLFYGKEGLGIFSGVVPQKSQLETWDRLHREELNIASKVYPRNAFEEMIHLTETGKLWSYPIDNEAGLEEQAKVPFYEHVLLDDLLEDLPDSEPVKEYMELVMVGITNNPYTTPERKKTLVRWYVDYFKKRESLLQQLGAMES
ncbi:mitochondrial ribosomal protein S31 [Brevipalpus obovatus]|uniref:mitochondrial ribosomal protein S31 n=1 Tax=Brevipalpus obovatus TaxID=246614 RepID=UPI003D9F21D4